MESNKFRKIFRYTVYLLIAVASFVIIRYYAKPKPIDTASNRDITLFIENAVIDIDQKLKSNDSTEDIATALSWHKSHAALYNDAKRNNDKIIKEQSKTLKDRIVKVQVSDFPKLRETYVDSKKEVLEKEHINIITTGNAKDTLTFTGTLFEPSKNKKKFMKDIDEIVKDLRFKKVVFKWSGKDTGYSDYEIKSKRDFEI